jgi:hypothetical protein
MPHYSAVRFGVERAEWPKPLQNESDYSLQFRFEHYFLQASWTVPWDIVIPEQVGRSQSFGENDRRNSPREFTTYGPRSPSGRA